MGCPGNLAALPGTIFIKASATAPEGYDKAKLENGVFEPLRELGLIDDEEEPARVFEHQVAVRARLAAFLVSGADRARPAMPSRIQVRRRESTRSK